MATDSVDIAPAVTLQTGGDSTRVARDSVPQADSSLQVDVAPVVTLQTSGDSTQVARDSAPQADSSLQPRANTYGISEASTQPKASVRRPVSDDVKPKITDGDRAPTVGDRATQRSELKEVRIQVASSDGRAGTLFSWVDTLPAAWSHQAIDFQGRKTGVRWSSLLRNALAICLAGLNFAFGAAWRSFTRVLVFGSISGDDEVLSAWICLAIGIAVLVPPMGLLHRLRLSYQESAQDAAVHGDVEKARMYNYRASNIAQIAGFACGSAIVYHLADAADVTLPRSHWGWRLLGVLLMQMVLWAFCLLLFWGSSRYVTTPRQRRLLNQISGAWVSYSAAATAFFLLDVMEVEIGRAHV